MEVFLGLGSPIPVIYFEMHARELDVVGRILDRLCMLGHVEEVNVISEDHSTWLWQAWCPVEDFMARLGVPPPVANVVVRMRA